MTGGFSVTLLEILAYLAPGGITLAAILYIYFPQMGGRALSGIGEQVFFLACSYVIGHLLTFISVVLRKLSTLLKKLLHRNPREKRMPFYSDLQARLKSFLCSNITRDDEYEFSLRLVIENQPHSGQTIDRLYAMTLFSRNTSLSLLLTAILFTHKDATAASLFFILSMLFFLRYIQLENITSNTVFRSAYVYLCSRKPRGGNK